MSTFLIAFVVAVLVFLASVISLELGFTAAIIEIAFGMIGGNFFGIQTTPVVVKLTAQTCPRNISADAHILIREASAMLMHARVQAVDLQAKLFRGLSDPSRLAILDALRAGPLTVTEIVERTRLSQSNVSNHLACLRDCGLVTCSQAGRFVHYKLSDRRVARLLNLGDELLREVARGVYECTRYNVVERR